MPNSSSLAHPHPHPQPQPHLHPHTHNPRCQATTCFLRAGPCRCCVAIRLLPSATSPFGFNPRATVLQHSCTTSSCSRWCAVAASQSEAVQARGHSSARHHLIRGNPKAARLHSCTAAPRRGARRGRSCAEGPTCSGRDAEGRCYSRAGACTVLYGACARCSIRYGKVMVQSECTWRWCNCQSCDGKGEVVTGMDHTIQDCTVQTSRG
jgi:hypothetical protein